jgi:hypothetical protein
MVRQEVELCARVREKRGVTSHRSPSPVSQSLAMAWGLSARLVSSDDRVMVFEIAMAG